MMSYLVDKHQFFAKQDAMEKDSEMYSFISEQRQSRTAYQCDRINRLSHERFTKFMQFQIHRIGSKIKKSSLKKEKSNWKAANSFEGSDALMSCLNKINMEPMQGVYAGTKKPSQEPQNHHSSTPHFVLFPSVTLPISLSFKLKKFTEFILGR